MKIARINSKFSLRNLLHLYLFKLVMAKVTELERRLKEIPNSEVYEKRIAELEVMLDE